MMKRSASTSNRQLPSPQHTFSNGNDGNSVGRYRIMSHTFSTFHYVRIARNIVCLVTLSYILVDYIGMKYEYYQHYASMSVSKHNVEVVRKRQQSSRHGSSSKNNKNLLPKTPNKYQNIDTPDRSLNRDLPVCVEWEDQTSYSWWIWKKKNADHWWTHHPEWLVYLENDTHFCFHYQDNDKTRLFRKIYKVQFQASCQDSFTKTMWSSGWSADFRNIVDGLKYALQIQHPFQVTLPTDTRDEGWHYASKKDGSRPVCATRDMHCYFLPLTKCEPTKPTEESIFMGEIAPNDQEAIWMREYATRPQQWLRKEVYDYVQRDAPRFAPSTTCAVMHVRRADVLMHREDNPRAYHDIQEYLDAAAATATSDDQKKDATTAGGGGGGGVKIPKQILLLTDDQNAVEEALEKHPDYSWLYIDRPRHRGAEGGWESQIPSDDPKLEVVVILSIYKLVSQCSLFMHGESGFADTILHHMDPDTIDVKIKEH